jgi:hypothetical protein
VIVTSAGPSAWADAGQTIVSRRRVENVQRRASEFMGGRGRQFEVLTKPVTELERF